MAEVKIPYVYYGTNATEKFVFFVFNNIRTFRGLDRNNDGKVSFSEVVRGIPGLITTYTSSALYKNEQEFLLELSDLTQEEMMNLGNLIVANFPDLGMDIHEVLAILKSIFAFRASLIVLHKALSLPKAEDKAVALAELEKDLGRFNLDNLRILDFKPTPEPDPEILPIEPTRTVPPSPAPKK